MDEETLRNDFESLYCINRWFCDRNKTTGEYYIYSLDKKWQVWLESARRADRKAREECEQIALKYSQAYGGIDNPMAIARDIRATIQE